MQSKYFIPSALILLNSFHNPVAGFSSSLSWCSKNFRRKTYIPIGVGVSASEGEVDPSYIFQCDDVASQSSSPPSTPDMEAYAAGYETAFSELPFFVAEPTVGILPDDLVGTYFRSGPAMFSAG